MSDLCAQAAVVLPGSDLLRRIYAAGEKTPGGVLSPACALCASVQAAEAIKLLCGRPSALAGRLLWMDLDAMEFQTLEM